MWDWIFKGGVLMALFGIILKQNSQLQQKQNVKECNETHQSLAREVTEIKTDVKWIKKALAKMNGKDE